MLKLIHTADLHLGISFDTLPNEKALICQRAQMHVLAQIIRTAEEKKVDAILIAGDLFDTPQPSPRIFRRAMELIGSAQCPVFLSPGNHDHICSDSCYLSESIPDNLHIFTNTSLEPYILNKECIIWGAAFDGNSAEISLQAPITETLKNICLIHTDLKDNSKYNAYSEEQIAASGFYYLAAGHNHAASILKESGKTYYARPGSPMATNWTETGTKGFFYIEIDEDIHLEPIIGNGLEFQEYTVDISPIPSDVGLQKVLLELIPKHHDHVIAAFTFTGERVYEPNFSGLANALEQVFFHCTIHNKTIVKKPLWRYLQSDDLRGNVSRNFRDRINLAHDESEKSDYLLAFRYALAAFDNDEPPK